MIDTSIQKTKTKTKKKGIRKKRCVVGMKNEKNENHRVCNMYYVLSTPSSNEFATPDYIYIYIQCGCMVLHGVAKKFLVKVIVVVKENFQKNIMFERERERRVKGKGKEQG